MIFILAKLIFVSVVFGGALMFLASFKSKGKSGDGSISVFWTLTDFSMKMAVILLGILLITLLVKFVFF